MEQASSTSASRSLFATCFAAIAATSFCFVLRALVIDQWGIEFALSETQKGELLGVGLWPFAISIILLSLVIDRIGFRISFWLAALGHLLGLLILFSAQGYWSLYIGTFVMSLANGAVEAAANPLIATVYRHDKPRWLNRLHAGWPGGMIVGGLLAIALGNAVDWRIKVGLMLLPVLTYTILLTRCRFPVSERIAAGVSYRTMLGEAGYMSALVVAALMMLEVGRVFSLPTVATILVIAALTVAFALATRSAGRPLYIILVLLMIPLATTELSTDSWISSLMAPEMRAIGFDPGWVLVYTSLLVFGVRIVAGSIIAKLGPLGTLAGASALAALGLIMLSSAEGVGLLLAATFYGIGKSFFWGTSLALTSEQFPRGGPVAINVVAGSGMLAAGVIGSVLLGSLQDHATSAAVGSYDRAHRTELSQTYLTQERFGILGGYRAVDPKRLSAASPSDRGVVDQIRDESKKAALADVAILPIVMLFSYLGLLLFFRRRGGYQPVLLGNVDRPLPQ